MLQCYISERNSENLNVLRDEFAREYYSNREYNELSYWEQVFVDYVVNPITADEDDFSLCSDWVFEEYGELITGALYLEGKDRILIAEKYMQKMREDYNKNLQENIINYVPEYEERTIKKSALEEWLFVEKEEEQSFLSELIFGPTEKKEETEIVEVSVRPSGFYLGNIDYPPRDWNGENAGYEKFKPTLYSINRFTPNGYIHPNADAIRKAYVKESKENYYIFVYVGIVVLGIIFLYISWIL